MKVMRWRNGELSGSDLANEPGWGSFRTYQPGGMPLPTKPRSGLRRTHQEMSREAASFSSQHRAAEPLKRARAEIEVQTNETMKDLNETKDDLERVKKTLLRTEGDRDMWRRLFEDCKKKQGEEIERLKQDYREQSERLALTTAVERTIPARTIPPDGASNVSRAKPNNGSENPNSSRQSNNPGHK